MFLTIVYGTRPEFLKVKVLIDLIRHKNPTNLQVIKIEQHTADLGDSGYYDSVVKIVDLVQDRMSNLGANILSSLPTVLSANTTHILVQGDTASVFYSALCGFQLKKKIIHLEAGMRTYDLENPFPEEGYRQIISRITDIHLCPSELEATFLKEEKVKGEIYVVGNTILDLVKSYDFPITNENKVLITLHRRENWDTYRDYVKALYELAQKSVEEFYFLVHMNPSLQGILQDLSGCCPKNMNIIQPLCHKDLIGLLSKCNYVITDSGGIQEEANFLGKHIYVLRKKTERAAISSTNLTLLGVEDIGANIKAGRMSTRGYEYGTGNSCECIYDILF